MEAESRKGKATAPSGGWGGADGNLGVGEMVVCRLKHFEDVFAELVYHVGGERHRAFLTHTNSTRVG